MGHSVFSRRSWPARCFGRGEDSDFEKLMKPGTSAVLVLDDQGDMEVILHAIRGLGGTVLKTNVDLERAKVIQTTLSAEPSAVSPIPSGNPK